MSYLAYVANSGANNILVVNTGTGSILSSFISGAAPSGIIISPNGASAYSANYSAKTVSRISTAFRSVQATMAVGNNPFGLALSSANGNLYCTNYGDGTVSVISTSTNAILATLTVGYQPNGIAITPDGTKAYVANGDTTVSVISGISSSGYGSVTSTISVGSGSTGVAVSPDGTKVYVANVYDNTVSVITVSTGAVSSTITVGSQPNRLAFTPDGTKVYVSNAASSSVSVINVSAGTVSTLALSPYSSPFGIAISPDGTFAYVACQASNTLAVITGISSSSVGTVGASLSGFNAPLDVAFLTDTVAPTVISAQINADGVSGSIYWAEDVSPPVLQPSGFGSSQGLTMTASSGGSPVISAVSSSVAASAFTLSRTVNLSETGLTLAGLAGSFTDSATTANPIVAFNVAVRNNSAQYPPDSVAPAPTTANVSAALNATSSLLTLNWLEATSPPVVQNGGATLTLTASGGAVTLSSVTTSGTVTTGVPSRLIASTETLSLAGSASGWQDNAVSSSGAAAPNVSAAFSGLSVTNNVTPPDAVAPIPANANLNRAGNTVTLNWTEASSPPVVQNAGATLTLTASGGAVTLSGLFTSRTATTGRPSRLIASTETLTLAGSASGWQDSARTPNPTAAFSGLTVTNNSVQVPPDTIPPAPQSASVNAASTTLTLNWLENGSPPVVQNTGATLTLAATGGPVTLSAITTTGTVTTATLSRVLYFTETLTLSGSAGGWRDVSPAQNATIAFSGLNVTNNSTASAPLAPPAVTFGTPPHINYFWSAPSSGAPTFYNIYEGGYAGGESFLAQVAGTVVTYTHNASPGNVAAYVTAVNATGEGPRTNEVTGTVPLSTTCVSSLTNGFNVNVPALSSGATTFNLQRAPDASGSPGTWATIATPVAPSAVFTDTGLTQGTKYWYRLQAVNSAGTTAGTPASCTTATAPDFSLTIATSPVQVVAGGSAVTDVISLTSLNSYANSFTLTITGLPSGVSGTITPVTQALTAGGTSTATLTLSAPLSAPLASGQVATITASSGTLTHTLSLPISVTVPPPAAPTGLSATPGDTIVTLTYPAPASGTTLSLYRGTATTAESGTAIATGQTSGTYVDSSLTNGTTYFYYAKNVLSGATSTQSIEVSATPLATAALTVTINSPATGSTAIGVVTFTAQTSGGVGGVQRVELYVQGSLVSMVTVPTSANTYTLTWDTRPGGNGVYGAYVKAYDYKIPAPNTAVSATISLTVNNPVPPAVQYFYSQPFTLRAGKNIKLAAATCHVIPATDSRTNKIITFGYNSGGASFNFDADYTPQSFDREFTPVTNTGAAASSDTMRIGVKLSALYSISAFTFTASITKMLPMTLATGAAGLLLLTSEPKLYTFDGVSSPVLLLDLTTLTLSGEAVSDVAVFQSRVYISLSGGAAPIPTRLYVFDNTAPDESFSIVPPFTSAITCLTSTPTTLYAGTQSGKVHTVNATGALAVLVPKTTAGLPYPISRLFPLPLAGANTTPGVGAATSDGSLWDIDTTDTVGNNAKLVFSPPDGTTTSVLSAAIAPDPSPLTTSTKYLGTGAGGNIFTYAAGGTTYALAYVAPFPVAAMASYAGTIYFGGAGDTRLWGKVLAPAAHTLAYSAVTDPITGITGINCMGVLTTGTTAGLYIGCATSSGSNTLYKFQAPTANAAAVYGKQISDIGYTNISYV